MLMRTRPESLDDSVSTLVETDLQGWEALVEAWKIATEAAGRAWAVIDAKTRACLSREGSGPALDEIVFARKASTRERHCRDALDEFLLKALDHELSREAWQRFCHEEA